MADLDQLFVSDEIADAYRRGYAVGRQVGRNEVLEAHKCPSDDGAARKVATRHAEWFYGRSAARLAQGDAEEAARLERAAIDWLNAPTKET